VVEAFGQQTWVRVDSSIADTGALVVSCRWLALGPVGGFWEGGVVVGGSAVRQNAEFRAAPKTNAPHTLPVALCPSGPARQAKEGTCLSLGRCPPIKYEEMGVFGI